MNFTLRPDERDPRLLCPEHWERTRWDRRNWAQLWIASAIRDDRRLKAAMGVPDSAQLSRRELEDALAVKSACCRLGTRAEHLWR